MPDLSGEIARVRFDPAIVNVSGIHSVPEMFSTYGREFGGHTTKSTGLKPRKGYETPIVADCGGGVLVNAVGLTNPGYKAMEERILASRTGKPIILSVVEDQSEKITEIVYEMNDYCDIYELNGSCPNLEEGETTGITIGKDPKVTEEFCRAARDATDKPFLFKMTPATYIWDPSLFLEVGHAAIEGGADGFSAINTIPGGMKINTYARRPVLTRKFGGVSGRGLKPIGVGAICTLYEEFGDDVYLIGMGGIDEAEDILEYVLAGANVVGIGTALMEMNEESVRARMHQLKARLNMRLDEEETKRLRDLRGKAHE